MTNNWFDTLPLSQIDHRLFVGGYAAAAALAKDNPLGITGVLCVHQAMDYDRDPGIVYQHVPFHDGEAIPEQAFVRCLGWLKFMHDSGHTVLVHCAAGISRSVTIAAAFMHYTGAAEFDEALERIRARLPVAAPAPAVLSSAKRMLGVWPYDGSLASAPEHELVTVVGDVLENVRTSRAALAHPDPACPTRLLLLSDPESNAPRHEIKCTCEGPAGVLDMGAGGDGHL